MTVTIIIISNNNSNNSYDNSRRPPPRLAYAEIEPSQSEGYRTYSIQ